MRHRLLAFAAALAFSPAWGAQLQNTFVSGKGADTGNCTMAAPCRSFQYGLSQTLPNGTLTALDSAGYGAVIMYYPATIKAPSGVVAIATAPGPGGDAIFIGNAVAFTLEGLTLDGSLYVDSVPYGTPSYGSFVRCTIRNGDASFRNNGSFSIEDSDISGNVALVAVRGISVGAAILRSRIKGAVTAGNGMDFVSFGGTSIVDSSVGWFSAGGGENVSYSLTMERSIAGSVVLQNRDVASVSNSTIDSLSIVDQAVVTSSGNNDIIHVSGNLQALRK